MIILQIISGLFLLVGSSVLIIGTIGLLRFPDFYTRLHAAGVVDTLGVMSIISGLILLAGFSLVSVKLLLILVFILLTSPTAAHALAKAALHGKLRPELSAETKADG